MARIDYEKQNFWGTNTKRQSYAWTGVEEKVYHLTDRFKKPTQYQIDQIKKLEEDIGVDFEWDGANREKADYFIRVAKETLKAINE